MSAGPRAAMRAMAGGNYISVESFRRDGTAVRTPMWFVAENDGAEPVFYLSTNADSFKVKRMRRTPRVRIAACDRRGRVSGDWVEAQATVVGEPEQGRATKAFDRKYFPWKQVINLMSCVMRYRRAVVAIRAAS